MISVRKIIHLIACRITLIFATIIIRNFYVTCNSLTGGVFYEQPGKAQMFSEGQKLFKERLNRVETAIHLGEPDKVPVFTFFSSYIQRAYNSNYSDIFYNFEAAGEAALKFHQDYPQLDIALTPQFVSGKANEIAGATMVDWPGRPGTRVSPFSSHQIIERELMMQEEYSEMLNDFSGFMLRKYVPRAFSNLKGTSMLNTHSYCCNQHKYFSTLFFPRSPGHFPETGANWC